MHGYNLKDYSGMKPTAASNDDTENDMRILRKGLAEKLFLRFPDL
jgi:hypothetical protein